MGVHPVTEAMVTAFATICAVPTVWSLLWGFFKDLAR